MDLVDLVDHVMSVPRCIDRHVFRHTFRTAMQWRTRRVSLRSIQQYSNQPPSGMVQIAEPARFVKERFTTATDAPSAGGRDADKRAAARAIGPLASFGEQRWVSCIDGRSNVTHPSKRIESLRYANFVWAMNAASSRVRFRSRTRDLAAVVQRRRPG
ncbi:hypothetical protein [Burkholderia ambifaria]|uniref:hypothetical protein n=1 Tax=Burkholderia ambifaria TaxID=152480 RepID=UPI0015885B1E|nr:hypothetical protein [Burkholderia ambifaria]